MKFKFKFKHYKVFFKTIIFIPKNIKSLQLICIKCLVEN